VAAFCQHLQRGAGQPPFLLHRLVRVGIAADVDRLHRVARLRQLRAQHFRQVGLGAQLRFEIQPRRQIQVAVRRTREAIDAAVLAAAVRIQRLLERDVGRVVVRDHAARTLFGHLGARTRCGFVQHGALPAIILGMVAHAFETPLRIGSGAATLDSRGRRVFGRALHPASLPRAVSKPATGRASVPFR